MSGSRGWRFGTEVPGLLRPDQSLPLDERLVVVEQAEAYFVTVAGRDADWLVRFERTEGVDAAGWAENMAMIYNRRFGASRPQPSEIGDAGSDRDAQEDPDGALDAERPALPQAESDGAATTCDETHVTFDP